MLAVINEKQLTEEQVEQIELQELAPEKFDADFQFKVNKQYSTPKKSQGYGTLTREETAALFAASETSMNSETIVRSSNEEYPTYTREDVRDLLNGFYEYKEEKERWDFTKTTESDTRTSTKMKPSRSTKT